MERKFCWHCNVEHTDSNIFQHCLVCLHTFVRVNKDGACFDCVTKEKELMKSHYRDVFYMMVGSLIVTILALIVGLIWNLL